MLLVSILHVQHYYYILLKPKIQQLNEWVKKSLQCYVNLQMFLKISEGTNVLKKQILTPVHTPYNVSPSWFRLLHSENNTKNPVEKSDGLYVIRWACPWMFLISNLIVLTPSKFHTSILVVTATTVSQPRGHRQFATTRVNIKNKFFHSLERTTLEEVLACICLAASAQRVWLGRNAGHTYSVVLGQYFASIDASPANSTKALSSLNVHLCNRTGDLMADTTRGDFFMPEETTTSEHGERWWSSELWWIVVKLDLIWW